MTAATTGSTRRRVVGAVLSLFLLVSVAACSSGNDAGRRDTGKDTDCTKQTAGVAGSNTGSANGTAGQGAGTGDCGGKTGFSTSDDGGTGSGG